MESDKPIRKTDVPSPAGLRVVRLSLRAGAELTTHRSKSAVVAVCVRGKGTFIVGPKSHVLEPGAVIAMEPLEDHSVHCEEDLELVVTHVAT